jgi:hypothetical protein
MLITSGVLAGSNKMQSYQIIAGFSDIKSELRIRAKTNKEMAKLRLWFSMSNDILYVHDFDHHKCCFAIAIKRDGEWNVRLDNRTFGHKLILETTRELPTDKIVEKLRNQYDIYGTFT